MFEEVKERIKKHEGFVNKIYLDSLGKATIGYGHLITPNDNFEEGVEYSKELLTHLLDNKKFDDAILFLKGNDGKLFGKQRLNTFFKNTKSIIGHLEIFIGLYEIYHDVKSSIFDK